MKDQEWPHWAVGVYVVGVLSITALVMNGIAHATMMVINSLVFSV